MRLGRVRPVHETIRLLHEEHVSFTGFLEVVFQKLQIEGILHDVTPIQEIGRICLTSFTNVRFNAASLGQSRMVKLLVKQLFF